MKRYRDIYCEKHSKVPTRSIVLCKLLGDVTSGYDQELGILEQFCVLVAQRRAQSGNQPFEVRHPIINDELLSEKREENGKNYSDFLDLVRALSNDIERLEGAKSNKDVNEIAREAFGESIVNDAVILYGEQMREKQLAGDLTILPTGILTRSLQRDKPIPPNTFHGEG